MGREVGLGSCALYRYMLLTKREGKARRLTRPFVLQFATLHMEREIEKT